MTTHLPTALSAGASGEQRSNDIWAAALETLSDEDRLNIELYSSDKLKVLSDLQTSTERAKEECIRKQWKYTRSNGKVVVLRNVFDGVLRYLEVFKKIGELVAKGVPSFVALPWAGVGFLLDIIQKDFSKYSFLIEGAELIPRLIDRFTIFESLYLQQASPAIATLRNELTSLYAAILKYLSQATAYFNQKTTIRMISGIVVSESDFKKLFEDIGLQQMHVDRCANLVDAEYRTKIVSDLADRHEKLLQLLKTLSGPISRMSGQLHEIQDHLKAEDRQNFLDLLSPLPYRKYHEQTRKGVLKGTGQWLLDDPVYKEWRDGNTSSLLWLHGNPGCGKSKLMSIVIDEQIQTRENGHGPPLAFFYCSRDTAEPKRAEPGSILASIAGQLATIEPSALLLEPAARRHQQVKKDKSLTLDETRSLLTELVDCYPVATIIIDALDECDADTRYELIDSLCDIVQCAPGIVKILVSSRNDQDIVDCLDGFPSIVITSDRNQADLAYFVTEQTNTLIAKRRLLRSINAKEELKLLIIEKLIADADGMFLWAALQLEVMCTMTLDDDVRQRLGRLPKRLAELYAEIHKICMNPESETSRLIFGTILKWLMCAQRTLTSAEFLAAVSLNPARWGGGAKALQQLFTKNQVLEICRNLVVYDDKLDTFRFAHLSVREFLEDRDGYSQLLSNAVAAETCLLQMIGSADCPNAKLFLLDKCNIDICSTPLPTKTPFHEYVVWFWTDHCTAAGDLRSSGLLNDMFHFFLFDESGRTSPLEVWVQSPESARYYDLRPHLDLYLRPLERSFLIASQCGFCDILGICLSKGVLNEEIKQRALALAVGQQTTFELILEEGNCSEIPEEALMDIASSGTSEAVTSLLDRKTKFTITAKVLESASSSKDDKVMKILLEHAEVNQITRRVLQGTADCGTPTNLKLMLDRLGDKTEITNRMKHSAIYNSLEMFKVLLDRGATVTDRVFYFAVLATRRRGGASLNELENLMGTVIQCTEDLLVHAAEYGDSGSVLFLLNRGGTVTEKVIEAAASNTLEILEILLQYWDGRIQNLPQIVRRAAANHRDAYKILTFLLDKQGDVEITPEMLQESVGDPDVLRLLLKRGGRTNVTEEVLLAIAKHPNRNILVPVLLSEGENVAITEDGLVALLGNLDYGDTARAIVDRTSPVDLTDRVLESAAGNGKNGEMLRMLFGRLGEARVTKEIILAAVGNFSCGMRLVELFEEQGIQVEVSPELLKAAASSGSSQMVYELAHRAESPEITEEILVAAARNINDVEIMPTFLNLVGVDRITDKVLEVMIQSKPPEIFWPVDCLKKLRALFYSGFNKKISERVVRAAAALDSYGCTSIMAFLLGRAVDIEITENVLEAAARNFHGEELLRLLLDRLGPCHSMMVTEAVIKASVLNRFASMSLLSILEKRGPIQITYEIYKAAVSSSDKEMVEELASRMGNLEVTEELLVAAAANHTEVFAMFLGKSGPEIITDEVLKAVIERDRWASDKLAEIFRRGYQKKIPVQLVISAVSLKYWAIPTMEVLLEQTVDIEITEEVVQKASENEKHRGELLKMLLARCAKENIPLSVDYLAQDE